MSKFLIINASNIINLLVAIGTIALALIGWRTLRTTKKSILAAEQSASASLESAKATKISVERMKDSLMPYLDLDLRWDGCPILAIRNTGPGLGIIQLVTVRNDIQFKSVYDPTNHWIPALPAIEANLKGQTRIVDFIIGSKEEHGFQLQPAHSLPFENGTRWLSSLSVYYEDVYGRAYRSRIIYTWDAAVRLRVVSKESFPDVLPIEICSDVRQIYAIENEKPVIYLGQYLNLHRKKYLKQIVGTKIPGTAFTNNQDLTLQKVDFSYHGHPDLQLQIGNNQPFRLSADKNNNNQLTVKISEVVSTEAKPFPVYGLVPEGNDDQKVMILYQHVIAVITTYSTKSPDVKVRQKDLKYDLYVTR